MSTPRDLWFTSTDSELMCDQLYPIYGSGSQQKQLREQRQYILHLAREHWRLLPGPARTTIQLAECIVDDERTFLERLTHVGELADRMITEFDGSAEAIADWAQELRRLGFHAESTEPRQLNDPKDWTALITLTAFPFWPHTPNLKSIPRKWHRPNRLRDIYFHPARLPRIDARVISEPAIDIARQMVTSGEFGLMGILADELETRGCDDPLILEHCRDDRHRHGHGPGCWVVEQCLAMIPRERVAWAKSRFEKCLLPDSPTGLP